LSAIYYFPALIKLKRIQKQFQHGSRQLFMPLYVDDIKSIINFIV
jgi:hypothetical protein